MALNGFQQIFWDEGAQDYRIPTHEVMQQISSREETKYAYDIVVNVFKAHGLSIIAALSAEVPGVSFSPFDSENIKDVLAARKAESLGKVITKINRAKLIFYHALFTLFTSHFVASYSYYQRDKKYGQVDVPKFDRKKMKLSPDIWRCEDPECNFESEQELVDCPDCSSPLKHEEGEMGEMPVETGKETVNKGMAKISVKGTLNVKIPTYAFDQEACGYLIDYSDQHYAYLRHLYPSIRSEISMQTSDTFERIARTPSLGRAYADDNTNSLLTLKMIWLRPWMFDSLEEDKAEELKNEFPDGVYFAVIDQTKPLVADIRKEALDDCWTIAKGDLSRSVHGDPLSKPLVPLQDLENMVTNLLVESLEHSVPSTFADSEVLDFETYSQQEVAPGAIYPTKLAMNGQKRLEDYFFTLKTSTLPKEGVDFGQIVESKSQFVVGAFPSIFGGPQSSGSKTLGEYQESRNYALQRLSIPYQMLYFWWADTIHKCVNIYISSMISDEKHSVKTSEGRFENISILQEDFSQGRFMLLLPESAIDLPVSFSQKRSTLSQIIQLNNEALNMFLFSPENKMITLRYLGLEELSDLDINQTTKQLSELDDLFKGMEVHIEPELDDHEIHLRIMKSVLSGPYGQDQKKNNPEGYELAMMHAKEHYEFLVQSQMQEETVEAE